MKGKMNKNKALINANNSKKLPGTTMNFIKRQGSTVCKNCSGVKIKKP